MSIRAVVLWTCGVLLLVAWRIGSAEEPRAAIGDSSTSLTARALKATSAGALPHAEPVLIGRQACATGTCHGGVVGRGPVWHASAHIYEARDPHATSGALLRDADSAAIVAAVDPPAAHSRKRFDRVLRTRCISCHVTVSAEETKSESPLASETLARGVDCESCHGAASAWLEPHTRSDWLGSARFTEATGMRDTEAFEARIDGCVRCHVGSRRADSLVRDVNHDLIAAGHPPLRFEARAFLANLPPHWDPSQHRDADLPEHDPTPNMRRFVVGRMRALRAAALLTAERVEDFHSADRVGSDAVWPELADFDCFACHQSLTEARVDLRSSSGEARYNPWLSSGIDGLPNEHRGSLQMRAGPAENIVAAANAIAAALDAGTAEVLSHSFENPTSLLAPPNPLTDWHDAVAWYLKSDAVTADLADPVLREELENALESIHHDVLRLVPSDGTEVQRVDSPTTFNIQRLAEFINNALAIVRSSNRTNQ